MSAFPTFSQALRWPSRCVAVVAGSTSASRRRRLRVTLVLLASLVGLTAAVHLVLSLIASRELRSAEAELRAAGLNAEMATIAPGPVPEAEDAAPVLHLAFAAMSDPQRPYLPGRSEGAILPGIYAAQAWFTDLLYPETSQKRGLQPHQASPDFLATDDCRRILTLIHDAATRPHCRFPIAYGLGWNALLPHLNTMRLAADLVIARCESNRSGHVSLTDAFALAAFLREEPFLISQMVGLSIDHQTWFTLRRALARGLVVASDAKVLAAALDHVDGTSAGLLRGLDSELVNGTQLFTRFDPEAARASGMGPTRLACTLYGSFLAYPLRAHDQACFLRWHLQARNLIAREGLAAKFPPPSVDEFRLAPLTALLLPGFDALVGSFARHRASLDMSRIALALARCRADRGAYPESPAALVPDYLDSIPTQPGEAVPYIYSRTNDGGCTISAPTTVAGPVNATWRLPP